MEIAKSVKAVNTVLTTIFVEEINRTLTQQAVPIIFLTQLPHSIFLRVVQTITQVALQLGKIMRLDGKNSRIFWYS